MGSLHETVYGGSLVEEKDIEEAFCMGEEMVLIWETAKVCVAP